ncbi:prepilin-type N-terminal cleavage/methylation domain-containing protein [Patulibacter minatonensis]|uniref:prepilin-type N-terminal cleavage/methylation domain-containing protein n=1 Tax=Patulibacter minatonensis TaxID=298163 RepID=UPI0012FC3C6D|nr:prepilin-type N-terminal cleavage/methylation domain-containing protein [Patulibacter minatonensis]
MRRSREQGFTLVETLVAITVLAVGMLATATVYDGSRGLTGVAERTSVMAHRAQAEIERIQALGWSHVALSGTPVPSTDPADPASMLAGGSPPRLRPDRRAPAATEPLVIDTTDGGVSPTSRTWSDGRLTGRVWSWVSWREDPRCGAGCTAARGGRRVTVVVTVDGTGHGRGPLVTSVVLTDPNAAPAGAMANGARNPLSDPATVCVSASGADVPCSRSIGTGSATSWFLYDTPAKSGDERIAVTADHALHQTVLGTGLCTLVALLGCPVPDLMGDEPPPSGTTVPPLLDRSSGTTGSEASGGRVLRVADTSCATTPTADNARSARWVTPAQPSGETLTGEGGMTLYTRTRTGVAARVVLCLQLAVAPGPVGDLLTLPPTVLATVTYELSAWPAVMTPVSFSFSVPGADLVVAAGKRVAVRVWLAASSASDVVIAYDHPSIQSVLQLNVR